MTTPNVTKAKQITRSIMVFGLIVAMHTTMASHANANIILVDDTTLNGSFENPSANEVPPTSWTNIDPNFNITTVPQEYTARKRNSDASVGSSAAMVGYSTRDHINENFSFTAVIDTNQTNNHTISLGDQYELSFDHIGLENIDAGQDEVRWTLFYTDDDTLNGVTYDAGVNDGHILGTTVNVIDTAMVEVTPNVYNSTGVIAIPEITDPNAVGRHLFLAFTSTNNNAEILHVDNVELTLIPEPTTMTLLAGGALMLVRRRINKRA